MKLAPKRNTWLDHVGIAIKLLMGGLVVTAALVVNINYWTRLSAGTRAHVVKECVAAVDMDSLDKYESAEKLHDVFGMGELVSQDRILPLPFGTPLLVLESEFNWRALDKSGFRRRVRILDGTYMGKS